MNAGSVVVKPWGGGRFKPYHMPKNLFELITLKGSGDVKTLDTWVPHGHAQQATWWNFHYPIFSFVVTSWDQLHRRGISGKRHNFQNYVTNQICGNKSNLLVETNKLGNLKRYLSSFGVVERAYFGIICIIYHHYHQPKNRNTENNTENSYLCKVIHEIKWTEPSMQWGNLDWFLVFMRKHKTMLSRGDERSSLLFSRQMTGGLSRNQKGQHCVLTVRIGYVVLETESRWLPDWRYRLILDIVWCEDSLGTRLIKYLTLCFFPSSKSRHEEDG